MTKTNPEKFSVETNQLGKRFGSSWVLFRVSLIIRRGESVALFGKNGSGKTTLLKMMATLLAPTTGQLQVMGLDSCSKKREIRQILGFLGHEKQLYETLTVLENLKLMARLRGEETRDLGLEEILKQMGILKHKDQRVGELSEGTQKRLMLARLLLGEAQLILLDEPYPTLDRQGKEILNEMIRGWRKEGKTILLASHDHERALPHADRLLVLENGTIAHDGEPK